MPLFRDEVEKVERMLIEKALQATQGNVQEAARVLELPRRTLWHKIKTLGIDYEKYRK